MTWWSYGKGVHRRDAIRALGAAGAGSFAPAGGQVSQRPDQGSNPPPSVVAPTQSAGTLRARTVIVSGPGGQLTGVFVYLPSVGAGNLIDSVTNGSGTDTAGNTFLPNITSYSQGTPSLAANLGAGALQWYTAPSPSGAWIPGAFIGSGPTNELGFEAGTVGTPNFFLLGPSGDTSGATDSAMFAGLSNFTYLIGQGTYYIDAPIVVPDQAALIGWNPSWGIPTGNYGAGGLPLQGSIITPVAAFSGAAAIEFNPTGDTSQHGGQRLYGLTLNGNTLPGGNTVDGIKSTGYVAGVKMRDVTVFGAFGGTGLHLVTDGTASHVPDFWQLDSCKFSGCHTNGVDIISLADSWFVNCEATGNTGVGWKINNSAGTRMIGCRGNNNATGINWSGLTGFTANFLVAACEFASNTGTGVIVGGTGSGLITLDAVDANSNGTQYSYSGSNAVKSNAAWNTSTAAPTFL